MSETTATPADSSPRSPLERTATWLDERLGGRERVVVGTLPGRASWRYSTGAVLIYLFGIELVTGLFLMAAYAPSAQTAWESVFHIEHRMVAGSLVRGIHHYATHAMVVLAALHLGCAIWDRAYRRPRELAWWLTLGLVVVLLVFSQTGYVLTWDQRSLVATGIATRIAGAAPGIGPQLELIARGGGGFGHATITRFYTLHVGVLPLAAIALGLLRLKVQRRLGFAALDEPLSEPTETTQAQQWWPNQAVRDALLCAIALVVVAGLAVLHRAPLGPPADESVSFDAARPEWWFLPVFRLLHIPGISELVAGHLVPAAGLFALAVLPFLPHRGGAKWIGRAIFAGLMLAAVSLGGLALYEDYAADDAHGRDFRASLAEAQRDAVRVGELAGRGIPPGGAAALLQADPLTQGSRLFAQFCSSCHAYDGHDGRGRDLTQPASAPDLGAFGTREWTTASLVRFGEQFAPLENVAGDSPYREAAEEILSGDEGYMLHWSREYGPALERSPDDLAAIVEYIAYQSGREDLSPYDATQFERGQTIYDEGTLANGTEIEACSGCHALTAREDDLPLGEVPELESDEGYPTMTGYGGTEWVRAMLRDPETHYGDPNAMPPFQTQLTETQIDMIARWLSGAYRGGSR